MGLRTRVTTSEVESIILGDIAKLKRDKGMMSVDEFLASKNNVYGKVELASELRIVTEDNVARLLQKLDKVKYFERR